MNVNDINHITDMRRTDSPNEAWPTKHTRHRSNKTQPYFIAKKSFKGQANCYVVILQ